MCCVNGDDDVGDDNSGTTFMNYFGWWNIL